jgi:predicted RNA binding protein YcfA (HicA-like mRNA interferase family)
MRLPRDLSGADLVKRLARLGYTASRQTGSHVRLTYPAPHEHHVTVHLHASLPNRTRAPTALPSPRSECLPFRTALQPALSLGHR